MASIKSVIFSALSPEQIASLGVGLTRPYTRGGDNKGTPYDPLLGVLDHGEKCHTCGEDSQTCPGHLGYIELPKPYYNPIYLSIVLGILRCICRKCALPLIPKEKASLLGILKKKGHARYTAYKKRCETISKCSSATCETTVCKIMEKNGSLEITENYKARLLPAEEVYSLFTRISSETMTLLGFNNNLTKEPHIANANIESITELSHPHEVRPEAFLFSIFPVTPPHARPWVLKGDDKCDDDLTERYHAIMKAVGRLKNPQETRKRSRAADTVQRDINTLFDNSKSGEGTADRKHKGLKERLSGKDGHIQINTAGKRVDFSGRAVIVGAGSLCDVDEIGVPEHIASVLTVPETVTNWNISHYEQMITEGKINSVIRGGFVLNVKRVTRNGTLPFSVKGVIGLCEGDVVERQLQDGDVGLFNRQPTLRIESMQGVKFKIMKGEHVFRLPTEVTRAYNADECVRLY